ncbi:hypothetical protein TrVE_jg609 [Triparma verrucosa]|uniref:Uncharacterized protein n=1 Tax=Triparma verrucosa TaxID=1606542 RepID=A0A9W7EL16_9STRA|nr:hypothetical protein TrVE_jg609 [Triparma verrucosa]
MSQRNNNANYSPPVRSEEPSKEWLNSLLGCTNSLSQHYLDYLTSSSVLITPPKSSQTDLDLQSDLPSDLHSSDNVEVDDALSSEIELIKNHVLDSQAAQEQAVISAGMLTSTGKLQVPSSGGDGIVAEVPSSVLTRAEMLNLLASLSATQIIESCKLLLDLMRRLEANVILRCEKEEEEGRGKVWRKVEEALEGGGDGGGGEKRKAEEEGGVLGAGGGGRKKRKL